MQQNDYDGWEEAVPTNLDYCYLQRDKRRRQRRPPSNVAVTQTAGSIGRAMNSIHESKTTTISDQEQRRQLALYGLVNGNDSARMLAASQRLDQSRRAGRAQRTKRKDSKRIETERSNATIMMEGSAAETVLEAKNHDWQESKYSKFRDPIIHTSIK